MFHSWGAIAHWLLVKEESEFSSEMWPLRGYPYCGQCLTPTQIKAALGGFSKLQKKNTRRWEGKWWWRGQGRLGRVNGRWIWQTHYRHVWNSQAMTDGEVAWWLRTCTAFAESLSLVLGRRRGNHDHLPSSSKESESLSGLDRHCTRVHILHPHKQLKRKYFKIVTMKINDCIYTH